MYSAFVHNGLNEWDYRGTYSNHLWPCSFPPLSLTLSLWETLKPQLSHSPRPKPKETTTYEEESHTSPLVAASELTLGFKSVMVLLQMRGMLTF